MKIVELRLIILNGWIYILAENKMTKISNRKLRYNGIPRTVIEYAILKSPNKVVAKFILNDLGIKTSRDFRQILYSAGFRGLVKEHFLSIAMEEGIKIADKITLKSNEAKDLFADINRRKTTNINT